MKAASTAGALGLAWLAWVAAAWLQEQAGLPWLGLVWPAACVLLACGLAARIIDRP